MEHKVVDQQDPPLQPRWQQQQPPWLLLPKEDRWQQLRSISTFFFDRLTGVPIMCKLMFEISKYLYISNALWWFDYLAIAVTLLRNWISIFCSKPAFALLHCGHQRVSWSCITPITHITQYANIQVILSRSSSQSIRDLRNKFKEPQFCILVTTKSADHLTPTTPITQSAGD